MIHMDVFDFINDIHNGKKNLLKEDPNNIKLYNAWVVNNMLSLFPDTIASANEMNLNYSLDSKSQYLFYLYNIRPAKRFAKWYMDWSKEQKKKKKEKSEGDIEAVMDYYKYNRIRAAEILPLLSAEQIIEIKKILEKGGVKK